MPLLNVELFSEIKKKIVLQSASRITVNQITASGFLRQQHCVVRLMDSDSLHECS